MPKRWIRRAGRGQSRVRPRGRISDRTQDYSTVGGEGQTPYLPFVNARITAKWGQMPRFSRADTRIIHKD
jgi:hypothetical protein